MRHSIFFVSVLSIVYSCSAEKASSKKEAIDTSKYAEAICKCCEELPDSIDFEAGEVFMRECLSDVTAKVPTLTDEQVTEMMVSAFKCECVMQLFVYGGASYVQEPQKIDSLNCLCITNGIFEHLPFKSGFKWKGASDDVSTHTYINDSVSYNIQANGDTSVISRLQRVAPCEYEVIIEYIEDNALIDVGDTVRNKLIRIDGDTLTIESYFKGLRIPSFMRKVDSL